MRDEPHMMLPVPRFAPAMKRVALGLAALWAAGAVASMSSRLAPGRGTLGALEWVALIPQRVVRGFELWRVFTYAWFHELDGVVALLFAILAVWWCGSPLERAWGWKRTAGLLGAAAVTGALAVLAGTMVYLNLKTEPTLGMSAPVTALLIAWTLQHADDRLSFFGLFSATGKQFNYGLIALTVILVAVRRAGADVASLGGIAAAYAFSWWVGRARPERTRKTSGSHLRVVEGGASGKRNDKRWLN